MPKTKQKLLCDNSIENFRDFAKICMYNFGTETHKFEKLNNIEDVQDVAIVFLTKKLNENKKRLADIENKTNTEILEEEIAEINKEIDNIKIQIEEENTFIKKLNTIYKDCVKWQQPSKYHNSIKDYMILVICEFITLRKKIIEEHNKCIADLNSEISKLSERSIRKRKISEYNHNIKKMTVELKSEMEEYDKDDKWAIEMLESLPL